MQNTSMRAQTLCLRPRFFSRALLVGCALISTVLFLSSCNNGAAGAEPRPVTPASPTATPAFVVKNSEPLSADQASVPVTVEIPELGLKSGVQPMEWQIAYTDGERVTQWVLPQKEAGWHSDSAAPGTVGNVIISGHQEASAEVFAPLVLNNPKEGQNILVQDQAGRTFLYTISQVTKPIPLEGATAEEQTLLFDLYRSGSAPRLTLITGWPEFTTTHRLLVAADYVGEIE